MEDVIILKTVTARCLYSVVLGAAVQQCVWDPSEEILADKTTVAKGFKL